MRRSRSLQGPSPNQALAGAIVGIKRETGACSKTALDFLTSENDQNILQDMQEGRRN